MSYLDGADAYQGDADSASSGFSETYLANIDTTLYSPYSSDETISSQFFKTSTDSMSSSGSHPENSSAFAGDPYVWNNRFQEALAAVRKLEVQTVSHRARIKTWLKLSSVASDFIHAATTYGKIIISEAYVPAEEKTIKPLSGRGIAGGEKYIVNSIMFKFAIDNAKLFGQDDHKASRVAGHDLLGLNCYLAAAVEGLYTPLVCLLDYRGFRLVALSLLPIGRDTLIYGSDDAGAHIHTDPLVHEQLLKCSKYMNTAEHSVVELSSLRKRTLAAAIDVEVHRSNNTDGRYYVVDCSRAMPPSAVCKDSKYKGQCNHLTMLLRPELVQRFTRPLNCDSYSTILFPRNLLLRQIQEVKLLNADLNNMNPALYSGPHTHPEEVHGDTYFSESDSMKSSSGSEPTPNALGPSNNHTAAPISNSTLPANHRATPTGISGSTNYEMVPDKPAAYEDIELDDTEHLDASDSSGQSATIQSNSSLSDASHTAAPQSDLEALMEELEASKTKSESDIADATNQLVNIIIPKFADALQRLLNILPAVQQSIFAYDWFVVWLHWHGINIRHIGTVRGCIPHENKTLRGLLLTIMVSRVLKNMANHRLRIEMKRLRYAGEFPYQQCIVSFVNLVFGTSTESLAFWNLHLKHALTYQFPDALTEEESKHDLRVLVLDNPIVGCPAFVHRRSHSGGLLSEPLGHARTASSPASASPLPSPVATHHSDSIVRSSDSSSSSLASSHSTPALMTPPAAATSTSPATTPNSSEAILDLPTEPICFLFFSFCRLVGLKLKASHMKNFASNPALFDVAEPLNVLDLEGAPEKVKTLQIVAHAQGLVWKVRAEAATAMPKSKLFAADMWKLSLEAYKHSLLASPRDQRTIRNVAEVYHALGFDALAGVFAHLAIETNPNDAVSLYKYATFVWATTHSEDTTKRYFEAAIRAPTVTPGAFLAYAEFCMKMKRFEQATSLVQRCLDLFPNSWDALHKMAYIQHFITKDYTKAHEYYKKALSQEDKDLVLLDHYVTFLRTIIKDESLASAYELFVKKLEQKSTISGRGSKLWDASYIPSPLPTHQ